MSERLTKEEVEVLEALGRAFGEFNSLEQIHPSDLREFQYAIHAAQNIILARPGMRQYQKDHGFSYNLKVNGA